MKLLDFDKEDINNPAVVHVLHQIDEHASETNLRLGSMEAKLDRVAGAFPASDFEGHRRYHETMIEMLAERRRLRIAIQEKTISGAIWAGIVFLGVASWKYLIEAISRGS